MTSSSSADTPAGQSPAPVNADADLTETEEQVHATLAQLLRRMRQQSDFPAMSESIVRVQSLANSETESVHGLTNEILKDVALTQKLLRLVNSAQFAHTGGGISTVSRAVSLIGFAGIRNLALSLLLLEHMQDKAHAQHLRAEFLRAQLAASLADDLCVARGEGEQAFIGALFQNLGRMLAGFYLPEEAKQVRDAVAQGLSEATATHKVLRLDYETLGLGVARVWGLPVPIQRLMTRPPGRPPSRVPADAPDRLRWLALMANDMADAVLACAEPELNQQLAQVARTYAPSLGLDATQLVRQVHAARERLAHTAKLLGLSVSPGSTAQRLMQSAPETSEAAADAPDDEQAASPQGPDSMLESLALTADAAPAVPEGTNPVVDHALRSSGMLTTGIQDVTQALVESVPLNDILRMVLETMYRSLDCRRVLLCLRDATGQHMLGRMGLGDDGMELARRFKLPMQSEPDLFGLVCLKNVDTLINDASAHNIAQRLPSWYRQHINAPTFLLLPLQLKGAPLGLIYADAAAVGALSLNEQQLSLLKTLRNQAVMAFRQVRS